MFPGLIFRPDASPVVLLLFHSGKAVITVNPTQPRLCVFAIICTVCSVKTDTNNYTALSQGGRKESDIANGWRDLWPIVKMYVQ